MGGNQSEMVMPYTKPGYSYTPVTATRSTMVATASPTSHIVISENAAAPLLKTMYHGVWSMIFPDSIPPLSRVGQCHVYDESSNTLIIAYGCGIDGKCLNDAWALNLTSLSWKCIARNLLSPRQYASAVLVGKLMYVFGGICERQFFGELHTINVETGECSLVHSEGQEPSPRTSPVLFINNETSTIFMWSGYDGRTHDGVYAFDLHNNEWTPFGQSYFGRAAASFCDHHGMHFIFGSAKSQGLLLFSDQSGEFTNINCTGSEPQPELTHSALASADEYIFLIGGEATFNYMHLYALDVKRRWWFAFHVRPDGESLVTNDGIVNKLGLFMMPREYAASIVYNKSQRELISVMGSRMMDPPPIFKIYLGDALGSMHMRSDMYEMFLSTVSSA